MRIGDGRLLTNVPHPPPPSAPAPAPPSSPPEPSPFARLLQGLGHEVDRGEAVVARVTGPNGGRELGNVELLALQASVYRYSEAVDLSAKLVDRAASGVKTVIQGQ